ncbi:MAG: hypothetical protein ACOZNI_07270 [Myxococcota bacterium]
MVLFCTVWVAEARVFDGVRIEVAGTLGGTFTPTFDLGAQPETMTGYGVAVGPDFHVGRWEVGGRMMALEGNAPLGWEQTTHVGPEFRLGYELDTPGVVAVVGGLGGGLSVYTRTVYDCWGSAGNLWVFSWDDRECGHVDRTRLGAVATASVGLEVSPRSRTVGLATRLRVRTDATVTLSIEALFGAGPARERG